MLLCAARGNDFRLLQLKITFRPDILHSHVLWIFRPSRPPTKKREAIIEWAPKRWAITPTNTCARTSIDTLYLLTEAQCAFSNTRFGGIFSIRWKWKSAWLERDGERSKQKVPLPENGEERARANWIIAKKKQFAVIFVIIMVKTINWQGTWFVNILLVLNLPSNDSVRYSSLLPRPISQPLCPRIPRQNQRWRAKRLKIRIIIAYN